MTVREGDLPVRLIFAERWWNVVLAGMSLSLLIMLTLAASNLIPGLTLRAKSSVRYEGASGLRIIGLQDVTLEATTSTVRATGIDPFIVVEAPATSFRVHSVEMAISPALTMSADDFAVFFIPARTISGEYVSARTTVSILQGIQPLAPGVAYSLERQDWRVNWILPEAARTWRIGLPEGADFRLDNIEVRGLSGFPNKTRGSSGVCRG